MVTYETVREQKAAWERKRDAAYGDRRSPARSRELLLCEGALAALNEMSDRHSTKAKRAIAADA